MNLTRGDVRGYELKCQTGKKLRAPRSLARYGRGYVYCPRGKLVLIGNGRPARVIVTWYAPAVGDYLAFKRVRTIPDALTASLTGLRRRIRRPHHKQLAPEIQDFVREVPLN